MLEVCKNLMSVDEWHLTRDTEQLQVYIPMMDQ